MLQVNCHNKYCLLNAEGAESMVIIMFWQIVKVTSFSTVPSCFHILAISYLLIILFEVESGFPIHESWVNQ